MINKKCPICKSTSFQMSVSSKASYFYIVEDGFVTADGMDDAGECNSSAICKCLKCGHVWHPKKVEFDIDN